MLNLPCQFNWIETCLWCFRGLPVGVIYEDVSREDYQEGGAVSEIPD